MAHASTTFAKTKRPMVMPPLEAFCGVFSFLAYRALFHSERNITIGSIVTLVALAAALTQLMTSSGLGAFVASVWVGGESEKADIEAPPVPGLDDAMFGGGEEAGGVDSGDDGDLKSAVLRQMSEACENTQLGVIGALLCKQLF